MLAGPEEATLVGNLLVQAMALGEIALARRGARRRARLVRAVRTYEPSGREEWREARERFAGLTDARIGAEVGA